MWAGGRLKAEPTMSVQDGRRFQVQKDANRASAVEPISAAGRGGHQQCLGAVVVTAVVGIGFANDLPHENHKRHGNDDAKGNEDDG
jgi:hypothetical protein